MKSKFKRNHDVNLLRRVMADSFEDQNDIEIALASFNDKRGTVLWQTYLKKRQNQEEIKY